MRGAAVVVLLTVMVACSPGDPDPDTGAAPPGGGAGDSAAMAQTPTPGGGTGPVADTALSGTRWMLVEVAGAAARGGGSPERSAHIEFDPSEGRASGNSSCNRFSGPYVLSGDSLGFGALISTKMACIDSVLNAQEVAFLGALEQTRRWRMAGDTLVLSGSGGEVAKFRAGTVGTAGTAGAAE